MRGAIRNEPGTFDVKKSGAPLTSTSMGLAGPRQKHKDMREDDWAAKD